MATIEHIHRTTDSLIKELSEANAAQSIRMKLVGDRARTLETVAFDHETQMAYYNTIVKDIATAARYQSAIDELVSQLDSNVKFGSN